MIHLTHSEQLAAKNQNLKSIDLKSGSTDITGNDQLGFTIYSVEYAL